jgi:hypothetical protein
VETTALATSRGKTAKLTVAVSGLADPVEGGVAADGVVLGVDHDDLVPLVGTVLGNPVRVEEAEVAAAATDALLGDGTEVAEVLLLVDTLVAGLAVDDALVKAALAATAANADAEDGDTLDGLVAEAASLLSTGGLGDAVNRGELAELPLAKAEHVSHHIGLLVAPELRHVLSGGHLVSRKTARLVAHIAENCTTQDHIDF